MKNLFKINIFIIINNNNNNKIHLISITNKKVLKIRGNLNILYKKENNIKIIVVRAMIAPQF
jgi:hypothetical protein